MGQARQRKPAQTAPGPEKKLPAVASMRVGSAIMEVQVHPLQISHLEARLQRLSWQEGKGLDHQGGKIREQPIGKSLLRRIAWRRKHSGGDQQFSCKHTRLVIDIEHLDSYLAGQRTANKPSAYPFEVSFPLLPPGIG